MSLEVHMLINNVDHNITKMCSSVEISGSLTSICRQATVSIEIGIYNKTFPHLQFPDNTPLWIKDVNEYGTLKEGLFSGVIVDYTKNNTQYQVTCFDYAYYLKRCKVTKNFSNITAEDATKEILDELGVEANYIYPSRINVSKLYAQQNAYDVIMDLYTQIYKQTGYKFYISASYWNKIGVYRVNWHKSEKIITPNVGNTNVSNGNLLSIEYKKTGSNIVNRVKVYDDNNQLIETMDDETCSFGQFGILQEEYVREEGKDYPTVVRNSIFHGIDKDISVEVLGNYDYYCGSEVKICVPWIDDLKQNEDGTYVSAYITSDTQTWDCSTGAYTTKLELTLNEFMDEKYIDDANQSSSGKGGKGSSVIKKALDWAKAFADDDTHGYQLGGWGDPDIDCSHFVISAYRNAGLSLANASYTGDMIQAFCAEGFEKIDNFDKTNGSDLKEGDILLNIANHTEMYIGDGKDIGAHTNKDGKTGDSSGTEVGISDYHNYPWDCVLRYTVQESISDGGDIDGWSNEFCRWVKSWEGFVDHWYDDGGGTMTIGIGTAVTSDLGKQLRASGVTSCTEDEAIKWMLSEMNSWWSILGGKGAGSLQENYQYFLCDYAYQYGYTNMNKFISMLSSGNVEGVCSCLGSDRRSEARKQLLRNGTYRMNS